MRHIVQDRHGYWLEVRAASEEKAIRFSSNLSEDANIEYASCSYVGLSADFSQADFDEHNRAIADRA